jgi:RNA polymerase sigma-70 factor (ECF subfamily)
VADVRDPDFYLAHQGYVRALARRMVYDPHAADDLFQAAWLAALERPPRDGREPRRWLARIVRNLASKAWLRARRRQQRELSCEPPPPPSSPDDVLAHEQERRRVVAALLELDEPYRSTLIARFFDGLEPSQIAARDGVPVETVRTRQKRGLLRLRERLLRGGASAVALVHGLRLGAPDWRAVLLRLWRGVLLMQTVKKVLATAGIALLTALTWYSLREPAGAQGADAPPSGPVRVAAAAPMPPAPVAVSESGSERTPLPAAGSTARSTTPTGALAVRVLWSDQRPAADIGVRVGFVAAPNFEASVVTARTGSDGRARFERLAVGEVLVQCDRGAQRQCTIRGGECTDATLAIERGVRIRGRVLDVDGRPAAGAEVYLLFRFVAYADVVARAADDGSFAIDDAPAERSLGLSARMAQRAPSPQQVVTADAGRTIDVELQFAARGGAVAGRVVDDRGEPVAAASVLVGRETTYELFKTRWMGKAPPLQGQRAGSDGRGDWLVDGVAAGDRPVLVVAPGFAPWSGKAFVVEGAVARCDAALVPAAKLAGVVRDERGNAVANATVRVGRSGLQSVATQSAGDGSYALDGLPLGPFAAMAQAAGAGEAQTGLTGTAGATLHWDPVLSRATTLRGRVVSDRGPVADARLSARCMPSAQQQWFGSAQSDADGWFEFTNCPDALLHLEVRTRSSGFYAVCIRDDVDVRGGEITLEVDPAREPTASAAGRVVDADGRPVAGADVSVLAADITYGGGHSVRTDADGRFRSPGCPPGDYYLMVRTDGWPPISAARRALTAGATTDWGDLALARGGTVVVTLQPDAGVDLEGLVVGIADANVGYDVQPPDQGVVHFADIGPGDYIVTAYARGAALRPTPLHVGAGPETTLALRVTAGSEVTVDVRDARGEPMLDRLETELLDGKGACIDRSPMTPGNGPMQWIRRLVADRYELRLRDHRGRTVTAPFAVAADGKPLRITASFP